jgi:antitoxin (DNA-binding transcriptional repressor) of toxin-antitoxin stability system
MTVLTLDEVERDVTAFLERVRRGETVIVGPTPRTADDTTTVKSMKCPSGLAKGKFSVPDDFDDPLPEEIQTYFEGRGE